LTPVYEPVKGFSKAQNKDDDLLEKSIRRYILKENNIPPIKGVKESV
jgi:hypothetical protein